jgi:glycosyltransferase involved in cell wall biosynthesis
VTSPFGHGKESSARIPAYALITPAHNEEAFIEKTIESVLRQTVLPVKWVVVDDGSTDRTSEIVKRYLPANAWMALIERPRRSDRSFAGKADAVNAAYETLKGLAFDVIGNVDADISFAEGHFEFLLSKFAENPGLGVAGAIFNENGYSSGTDSFAGRRHVSGHCQLFRRRCWEEIGGYFPHRAGGVDWIAVTTARMNGWQTEAFRESPCRHHRKIGTASKGFIGAAFSRGERDYFCGGHPLWEIFRVGYRCTRRPYLVGGIALGCGFLFSLLRRTPRPVSRELMAFHRKDQMARLRAIARSLSRFEKLDGFNIEGV